MTAKKFLPIIIVLLLSFALASCVGIGDGALFDDVSVGNPNINMKTYCVITVHGAHGESLSQCSFNDDDRANDFAELLQDGEYVVDQLRQAVFLNYIELAVFKQYPTNDMSASIKYRVYSDDYVTVVNNSGDTETKGFLEGSYDKIFELIASKSNDGGYICDVAFENLNGVSGVVCASGESVRRMFYQLKNSEYAAGLDRTTVEKSCIYLDFWGSGNAGYYIWSDDHVDIYDLETSSAQQLGQLDGIYQKAQEMLVDSLHQLSPDEAAARYHFDMLLVAVDNSKSNYDVSDFADVGCIYLKKNVNAYMTLYFACDSAEELEKIIEKLEAREDVGYVGRNYIALPAKSTEQ